jgi:muramoyltetrapeptide carboxypeptidase
MGFSDSTALLNAITTQTGLVTFHGPMLISYKMIDKKWWDNSFDILEGKSNQIKIDTPTEFKGPLYGGNLAVLQTLIGTAYAPNLDQAILIFEDINEHISRYDRMIAHMRKAGWLEKLQAIILGEFLNPQDNKERPFGFTIEQIIKNNAPDTPLITNAPFGHGNNLCTLPIGANAVLKNSLLSFKPLA